MAEKIVNTRLQLKIDTYQNWTDLSKAGVGGNLVLKKGEIGLCEIPSGNNAATTAPTILFKVGDGTLPFHHADPTKCLKWASALAADVYAWAKKSSPDWTDFPALPITITDTETGKFVTDFEYTNNTLTIHRANISLSDLTDKDTVALSADLGAVADLTTTAKTAVGAINEHDTEIGNLTELNTTVKSSLVAAINEALQAVETGGTGSVVTITKETTPTAGSHATYVLKQGGKAVGDKIEIPECQNSAHSHTVGSGLKLTGAGGVSGETKHELNLTFVDDATNKKLKLVDATDNTKIIAEFDTTNFVKDGMLQSVVADQANNKLTFTWNTDGATTETVVELDKIADIYTAGTGATEVQVAISNANVITATLVEKGVDKSKLAEGVQASLDKANTAIQDSDLAAIAKTGNVNDLVQTEGDILVFNCGSATTVI